MKAAQLRRMVGKVAAVIGEMNEAQRRMIILRSAPDRYLLDSHEGPETYHEFLVRTSGPLLHEPPGAAAARKGTSRRAQPKGDSTHTPPHPPIVLGAGNTPKTDNSKKSVTFCS